MMRAGKWALVAIVAVLLVAIAGGVYWYTSVPHTADAQFAYAEKLEKKLKGDAATKSVAELGPDIQETIEQFRRVGTRFGKSPKAAEGLKHIADIDETIAKDQAPPDNCARKI